MMYFVKEYEQPKDARRCLIDNERISAGRYYADAGRYYADIASDYAERFHYAGIALDCAERFHYAEKIGGYAPFPVTIVLLDGDELDVDAGNTVLAECKIDRLVKPVFDVLHTVVFDNDGEDYDNKFRNVGDPLDCLVEGCAELIKVIMKVRRFGLKSHHPGDDETVTNEISLLCRMRDVELEINTVRDTVCTGFVDHDDQKQDLARLQKIRKFVHRYKELDVEVRNTDDPGVRDDLQQRRDDVGTTIENIVWGL